MSDEELDKVKDFYYQITGKKLNLNANWTSLDHVNIRRLFLNYRKYIKIMSNDIGIVRVIKKHYM
jgi:hypothetical protein